MRELDFLAVDEVRAVQVPVDSLVLLLFLVGLNFESL